MEVKFNREFTNMFYDETRIFVMYFNSSINISMVQLIEKKKKTNQMTFLFKVLCDNTDLNQLTNKLTYVFSLSQK